MKHRLLYIPVFLVLFLLPLARLTGQPTSYSMTFFVQPLPAQLASAKQLQQDKAKQAKKLTRFINREFNSQRLHAGIYVTYLGYMTHSDSIGQVILPRKTAQDRLQVLVTQDIKPVSINTNQPNTLLGFIVDPHARARYYSYYLKQNPETELLTWYVTEEPVPQALIPVQTIIIFEDPDDIIIPVGTTSTFSRDNLVLPTVYITPTAQLVLYALRFLKLRKFFSAVAFAYARIPMGYQQQLI